MSRLSFEPLLPVSAADVDRLKVTLGREPIGEIRPAGRTRVAFSVCTAKPISAATLKAIAAMVEHVSTQRRQQRGNRPMRTYLVYVETLRQDALINPLRTVDDESRAPIGFAFGIDAADARTHARKEFRIRSNQRVRLVRHKAVTERITQAVNLAATSGVTMSFRVAYALINRQRSKGKHFVTHAAVTAAATAGHAAHGNGLL